MIAVTPSPWRKGRCLRVVVLSGRLQGLSLGRAVPNVGPCLVHGLCCPCRPCRACLSRVGCSGVVLAGRPVAARSRLSGCVLATAVAASASVRRWTGWAAEVRKQVTAMWLSMLVVATAIACLSLSSCLCCPCPFLVDLWVSAIAVVPGRYVASSWVIA